MKYIFLPAEAEVAKRRKKVDILISTFLQCESKGVVVGEFWGVRYVAKKKQW